MTDHNEALKVLNMRPIELWDYPRILVGVPLERSISYSTHVFYNFWAIAQQGVPILKIPYQRVDVARNRMAIELLKTEFTHLLMLDLDHKHPTNIIQKLARWVLVKPDIKVVGGLNFRRNEPYDPCCGFWGNDGKYYPPAEWEQGLIKVDVLGTGSILINREVFEIIPPPWFTFDYSRVWADQWIGEDVTFSKRCNEHNINLYVDTTCTSPHMNDTFIDEETFKTNLKESDIGTTEYAEFMEQTAQLSPR